MKADELTLVGDVRHDDSVEVKLNANEFLDELKELMIKRHVTKIDVALTPSLCE